MVRVAELAEAEGRVARRATFRATVALCLLIAASAVLLGSLALFVAAGYVALTTVLDTAVSLVVVAGGLLLGGLCVILLAVLLNR